MLADVDLTLAAGRVHALLGIDGRGRSTLVKVPADVRTPDRGTGGGEPAIAFVHQNLGLIGPPLSVTESLALASAAGCATSPAWIDRRRGRREARATPASYGLDLDPSRPVDAFGPAEQTMIAVARAPRYRGKGACRCSTSPRHSCPHRGPIGPWRCWARWARAR